MVQLIEGLERKPGPHSEEVIAICGAGALGGNLAEALASRGYRRLRVVDGDWVEEQNLDAQPFSPRDIGAPKARTLARNLYEQAEAEVEPLVVELTAENARTLLAGSHLVVDAFDRADSRRVVAEACASLSLPCLHLVADPEGKCGNLFWDNAEMRAVSGGRDDFSPSKSMASLIANAGYEAIDLFLATGEKRAGKVALDIVAA